MKLADFLLSIDYDTNLYNGHIQTVLNCIKEQDLKDLLEEVYNSEKNNKNKLKMSLYTQKQQGIKTNFALSLYQKDYWKENENGDFKDRLIICFDKIIYEGEFNKFKKDFLNYLDEKSYFEYDIDNFN